MAEPVLLDPRWDYLQYDYNKSSAVPTKSYLHKINAQTLSLITIDGELDLFIKALSKQRIYCKRPTFKRKIYFGDQLVEKNRWCRETTEKIYNLAKQARNWKELLVKLKLDFDWYQTYGENGDGDVFFTGYYLPLLYASYEKTDEFFYPIYLRPNDLVTVKVNGSLRWRKKISYNNYELYDDRYQIDYKSSLADKNLEIVYTNDYIGAFFTHIQGSARISIIDSPDKFYINYAAQNGLKYVSIGKVLKDEGKDQYYWSSLQGLTEYLTKFPEEQDRIFPMNPSYIFFKKSLSGAKGSTGISLTPKHSIAIDNKIYPYGAVGLIQSYLPVKRGSRVKWKIFSRLITTQDTGGAIKGPSRVDIFFGDDEQAEFEAGHMSSHGKMYFLLSK